MLRKLENRGVRHRSRGEPDSVIGLGLVFLLAMPCTGLAQARALWLTPDRLTTPDGVATLRWSVEGGEAIALFRISEEYSEEHQISYTDQAEIQVVRSEPGDYSFWVQACTRYADGYPLCGESSRRLTLIVREPATTPTPQPGKGNEFPDADRGLNPEPGKRFAECGRCVCK